MSFGVVEKGPRFVTIAPPPGQTLCDTAVQYAFYDGGDRERGDCFATIDEAKSGCPDGWEFVTTTERGCDSNILVEAHRALGLSGVPVRPICRKTQFEKQSNSGKLECCLRQDASTTSGTDCPPGFCKQKINESSETSRDLEQGCFDVFRKHCLGERTQADGKLVYDATNMFFDADCKAYVLRKDVSDGPNQQKIASIMTQVCKAAGRFVGTDSLCKCLVTQDENFCTKDDCFARMNRQLASTATCLAPECKADTAKPGTYLPPPPKGGCPTAVCAPLLQAKCVNLTSSEAINLINVCVLDGKLSEENAKQLYNKYGITQKDIGDAAKKRGKGELHITTAAPKKKAEPSGEPSTSPNEPDEDVAPKSLPNWAIWVIGAIVLVLVTAIVLGTVVAIRAARRKRASEVESFTMQELPIQRRDSSPSVDDDSPYQPLPASSFLQ